MQWQAFVVTTLLISLVILYLYFFWNVSLLNSFIIWILAISIAGGGIGYYFKRIHRLQTELTQKINLLEKQSQRDAALALLSGGFSSAQDES